MRKETREDELEPEGYRKDRIAVVYGKQDYMWQVYNDQRDMNYVCRNTEFACQKPATARFAMAVMMFFNAYFL